MEELLNKLIEKGWKPFGYEHSFVERGSYSRRYIFFDGLGDGFTLRQIVSKESGLWQFCIKNKLVNLEYDFTKSYKDSRSWTQHGGYNGDRYLKGFDMYNCEYWLIESALTDEDKLEQFLLDNIKIK